MLVIPFISKASIRRWKPSVSSCDSVLNASIGVSFFMMKSFSSFDFDRVRNVADNVEQGSELLCCIKPYSGFFISTSAFSICNFNMCYSACVTPKSFADEFNKNQPKNKNTQTKKRKQNKTTNKSFYH